MDDMGIYQGMQGNAQPSQNIPPPTPQDRTSQSLLEHRILTAGLTRSTRMIFQEAQM
jgi:hypothetical protein